MRMTGRKISATTMIPSPPSHCSIERHSSRPGGILSNPTSTVVPVVVRPDIDSNRALVQPRSGKPPARGMAAKAGSTAHVAAVSRKDCRRFSARASELPVASTSRAPADTVIRKDRTKTFQSSST